MCIPDSLRTGDWLHRDRMIVYPLVMLAITAASTIYVLIANGGVLPNGSPFGSDFVSFWVAAREALAGHPDLPYDADRFAAAQDAIFRDGNFYAFYYPPHYLAYMLPFGALPFYVALGAWMALSFAAALLVITRIAGRGIEVILLAIAFPATFLTIAHGQNAFLSAALFGGALVLLPKRPVIAGVLLGLLTFKPQLGLLIPFALVAGGYWRTVLSAAVTTLVVATASAILLGSDTWMLFLLQSGDAMETLRSGLVGWNKMISTYAALRLAGLDHGLSMTIQAIVSLAVAGAVIWTWRRRSEAAYETRAALLLAGALLATPFGLNYDVFLLAPAIAFMVVRGLREGFVPYEKSLLAVVYVSPFAMLWLMADNVAIAPIVIASLFSLLVMTAVQPSPRDTGAMALPAE